MKNITYLMKDFLNTASDLNDTVLLRKGSCFEAECDTARIHYNLNDIHSEGSKLFRAYWTEKCPMLKGFATVTILLLHELGHLETDKAIRKSFSYRKRENKMDRLEKKYGDDYKAMCNHYFEMVDEKTATAWAINWLSDSNNRKIAKNFEKKFFACKG